MKNPLIVRALIDMIETEQRQIKVSLIEDIFKAGRCLAGFNTQFSEYLLPTTFMFDCLYELDIERLELLLAQLSATLRQEALKAMAKL